MSEPAPRLSAEDHTDPVLQPGIVEEVASSRIAASDSVLQPGIVEEISLSRDFQNALLEQPGIVREIPLQGDGIEVFEEGEKRSLVRLSLKLEAYYDDNVFISDSNEEEDFVWKLVPGIYYESASARDLARHYLAAGYDPEAIVFMDLEGIDAFNNRGFVRYRFNGNRTGARLYHRSEEFTETSRDVGNLTEGDRHVTLISGEMELSGASAVEAALGHRIRNYDSARQADSREWWLTALLRSEISSKVQAGAGPRFGWFDIDGAPNQTYQKALVQILFKPSAKLGFEIEAGADFRQFEQPQGAGDEVTPEFALEATWKPRDATTISATSFRNIVGSVSGQNFVATGAEINLRQRFLRRIHYNLSVGLEHAQYESTRREAPAFRVDDFAFVRNAIEYEKGEQVTLSLFHRFETNDSNARASFDQNQFGLLLTVEL